MRISDWSSDVCSSDLLGDEAAGAPGFPIHCIKGTVGCDNVFLNDVTQPLWNPPTSAYLPPVLPVFTLEKGVFDMWAQDNLFVDCVACEDLTELSTCAPAQNVSFIDGSLDRKSVVEGTNVAERLDIGGRRSI